MDADDPALPAAYDELPLWSAPFGLRLLEAVVLRPDLVALDVGCGTGFPLIELAQRLGPRARVHGVDPWGAALARARDKLAAYGVTNVTLHQGVVEHLPLGDGTVDLITSNNGLSNVADVDAALAECARVARPGAQLVHAYNLPGSMRELYDVYDALLAERGQGAARAALAAHIDARRKPLAWTAARLEAAGFRVERVVEDAFRLRYADARALFAHAFVRIAFLPAWGEVVDPAERAPVLAELARRLDAVAAAAGELALSIPFACLDCRRG